MSANPIVKEDRLVEIEGVCPNCNSPVKGQVNPVSRFKDSMRCKCGELVEFIIDKKAAQETPMGNLVPVWIEIQD